MFKYSGMKFMMSIICIRTVQKNKRSLLFSLSLYVCVHRFIETEKDRMLIVGQKYIGIYYATFELVSLKSFKIANSTNKKKIL